MSKIWVVKRKNYYGGGDTRQYTSEVSFMESTGYRDDDSIVTIYEEVEKRNVKEYRDSIISQRQRDEQISTLLGDNQDIIILSKILDAIKLVKTEKWMVDNIVNKFKNRGLSKKTFKSIISSVSNRNFLLFRCYNTVEWYKLLLSIHGFQIEEKYKEKYGSRYFYVDKEIIKNYNIAKEELKKNKLL